MGPTSMIGRLFGVGIGPGDPELMTVKAARLIAEASVVAYFAAVGKPGNARRIIGPMLKDGQRELRLEYPVTTENLPAGVSYETLLVDFYDSSAKQIAELLDIGLDVVVVCEGDPFLFGSYMYVHNRLADRFETSVVPGVPSMLGGTAALGAPLVCQTEVLTVMSGLLETEELIERLGNSDAAVIMKVGRNLSRVREAVDAAGLTDGAFYVERVTMSEERVMPLAAADASSAPYFSMVIVPSRTAPKR